MYEVGRAGAFVTEQKWRRRASGTLYGIVTVVLAITAVGLFTGMAYTDIGPVRAVSAVAGAASAAGCWYAGARSRQATRKARQAAIGARSEREAQAAIRRTGSIAVAYGLMLGDRGGDCDVVVFTRGHGAAAVEVKTGHGTVVVDDDVMRIGMRVLDKSPTRQAANQARLLSRGLGHRAVISVVCVPGMRNRPFTTHTAVWVCSADDLGTILDRAPRIFDTAAEARETMKRLWRRQSMRDNDNQRARKSRPRSPVHRR